MKPESPTLMPRITFTTSLPTAIEGQPPPCTKSSYVALVGAKVLVSCRKPPTAMRVIKGSQVRLVCDVRPAIASSARSEAIRLLHAACVRIAALAAQGNRLCRHQDERMSLRVPERRRRGFKPSLQLHAHGTEIGKIPAAAGGGVEEGAGIGLLG